jgi:hypothetical protein
MKISKGQWDILLAKLDWLGRMVRDELYEKDGKGRVTSIEVQLQHRWDDNLNVLGLINEQQDKLLQSHAALEKKFEASLKGLGDGLQQGIADLHKQKEEDFERHKTAAERVCSQMNGPLKAIYARYVAIDKKLGELQGKALHRDFQQHSKPKGGKRGRAK